MASNKLKIPPSLCPQTLTESIFKTFNNSLTSLAIWSIEADTKKISDPKTTDKERKLLVLMRDYPNLDYKALNVIKAPVLLMSGDRDFITLEHTVKMFQNILNSHLCIIPGATHGASWEKQDLFLKLLYDFFDKPFVMPDTKDWITE